MVANAVSGRVETARLESLAQTAAAHAALRKQQRGWAAVPVRQRLHRMKPARHAVAADASSFAWEMPAALQRSEADTLVSEVLPLLDAWKFLERSAERLLAPRAAEEDPQPLWLRHLQAEVRREAVGLVLIISPGNYPLFLGGVQVLQALAAGNAVLWKPAPGCHSVAGRLAEHVNKAVGETLVTVLEDSPSAATEAIRAGVDKVFLTGSSKTGEAVMSELAKTATPSVMELSGCDAVFVLDGADLEHVTEAVTFGLRLNGSATCMAPRRLFARESTLIALRPKLVTALRAVGPVRVAEDTQALLAKVIEDARIAGAEIVLDGQEGGGAVCPTLISNANPDMLAMRTDIFAPVLSLMAVRDEEHALAANAECPYALTAAVFGDEKQARALADRIDAGMVFINDVIAASADPRVPFGGRRRSGFGVSRGAEGLLEMTVTKTVLVRRGSWRHIYEVTTPAHRDFFAAFIAATHGKKWSARFAGLRRMMRAGAALSAGPDGAKKFREELKKGH